MLQRVKSLVCLTVAVVLATGAAACSSDVDENENAAADVELAEPAAESASEAVAVSASREEAEHGEARERGEHDEGREGQHREGPESGEHAGDEHGEEGEESGVYLERTETWDATRRGARLVLSFDAETGQFSGRVTNTTSMTLCAVRIEVHLEGGVELGPTDRGDLGAGESVDVTLASGDNDFDRWTVHPEVSSCGG